MMRSTPRLSKGTRERKPLKTRNAGLRGNLKNSKHLCQKRIRVALIVSFLLPLLTSCASDPVIQKTVELQRVPESLLTPCPVTQLADNPTYADAINLARQRGLDLQECNKRFDDIRKWSAQ